MSTDAAIEDVVLEEIFERESPKCEAMHSWANNPLSTCTVEVTHILFTCKGQVFVCLHTALAFVALTKAGATCSAHYGPHADHTLREV